MNHRPDPSPNHVQSRHTARVVLLHNDAVLFTVGGRNDASEHHLPGGGADDGEFLTDAAVREVLEETGLTITVGDLLWVREARYLIDNNLTRHRVDVVFAATAHGDPLTAHLGHLPGHTRAVAWVRLDQLHTVTLQPPELAVLLPRHAAGLPVPTYHQDAPEHPTEDQR